MQPKLLKFGTALSVVGAFLTATTAPAAAGGYDYNAALINTYIQSAPWTSYGDGYAPGWKSWGGSYYDAWDKVDYGWKTKHHHTPYDQPYYKTGGYGWSPEPEWRGSYVSELGHGTVTYYDHYGDTVIYGEPAYAKRTTIVHPTVDYDGYSHVRKVYVDDHVLHVRKHATDLRDPVFFEFGSSTLTHEAKYELDKIGQIISAYYFDNPKVLILLSGFTDATGTSSANQALAKARNHAVKDYLIQNFGFSETRFVLRAVGEEYANMSGMPYSENQRRVVVSLVGLPKSATEPGHPHEAPIADGHEMVPPHSHEMTEAPAEGLDKGMVAETGEEMTPVAPAEEHAMVPAPVMKPMPKPVYVEAAKPVYAHHMKPVTRCTVPSGPYAGTYVNGQLVATLFTDIDDYGGGKLEEVCVLSY